MIDRIMVSLKSLDLPGRIVGVDINVVAQEQIKRFLDLHVKIFIQTTAEHRDLTFASNSSSRMSATKKNI